MTKRAYDAWCSFRSTFPEDPNPEETRCSGIGRFLEHELSAARFRIVESDCWRDCGWELRCQINGVMVDLVVSYVNTGQVQFILVCGSGQGLVGWLLGIDNSAENWELARAVHRILSNDDRFTEIRWYVETGWGAGGDEPWQPLPA